MARKKHRRSREEGTELNLAAMLDMAFQLLIFFVFTFSPTPIESQIGMQLPPPLPVAANLPSGMADEEATPPSVAASKGESLRVTVLSGKDGSIRDLAVGNVVVADLNEASTEVRKTIAQAGGKVRQLVLQIDEDLPCQKVLEVLAACQLTEYVDRPAFRQVTFVALRDSK